MNKMLIITQNKYPNGDAGAVRQHVFAKMFQELGFDITILGFGEITEGQFKNFDGVNYTSFRINTNNLIKRIINRLNFTNRVKKFLETSEEKFDIILVIDGMPKLFRLAEKYQKKYNCLLLHDSVEWYSKEEFKLGRFDYQYILKNILNKKTINKKWKVIAISTYLEEYFLSKGIDCIRVPIIFNSQEMKPNKINFGKKIIFSYVGAPGKKDYLKNMLEGFSMLSKEDLGRIHINIVGSDEKQIVNTCGVSKNVIDALKGCLHIHGRVNRDKAVEILKETHFSILLRDSSLRYAKAGFPTKVVESLMYGVPLLCNYSSDLNLYLNNKNSIIVNGFTASTFCDSVKMAISLDNNEILEMHKNARETAISYFDYKNYIHLLKKLLKK